MNGMRGVQWSKVPGLFTVFPGYRNKASSPKPTQFSAHNASVIYIDNFYANIGAVWFFLP